MDRSRIRGALATRGDAEAKERIVGLSPFGELTGGCREAFLELARAEVLPRRACIVDQGEPTRSFVLLGSGRVRLERARNGRAFPLGHRGPGETVGEGAITGSTTAAETATVVDEAEAVILPMAGVRKLCTSHPSLRAAMAAALVDRHRVTEERLESLLLHGVEARLIDFLFCAARRWGSAHAGGELVNAPFTHADIALLIGSTRETVTLLLGKLKREGLVQFDKRRIVIRDRGGLERRAAAS
jgi:CRP-like cAMP-binding protein